MLKSKINVYARLKPKASEKNKILFEINELSSNEGKEISKLTLTNKKGQEKSSLAREKLKSTLYQNIASNSKKSSKKAPHNQKYSKKWDHQ